MTTEYEADMLMKLKDRLCELALCIYEGEQWFFSYVDKRTPYRPNADVSVIVGHRSINHGNAMFRIDTAEVERIERAPDDPGRINTFRKVTENGFRVSRIPETPGDTELECFDVLTARDALAALYGYLVCHHADELESAKRTMPPQPPR